MANKVALFCGHAEEFTPRVQAWLGNSKEQGFGRGRMELLQLIRQLGSLSKAAKELGMSYRAAWGKIKEMEQFTGVHLVCSQGAKRDGYALTPEAVALMDAFEHWYADVSTYARERAGVYFPAGEMVASKNLSPLPASSHAPVPSPTPSPVPLTPDDHAATPKTNETRA